MLKDIEVIYRVSFYKKEKFKCFQLISRKGNIVKYADPEVKSQREPWCGFDYKLKIKKVDISKSKHKWFFTEGRAKQELDAVNKRLQSVGSISSDLYFLEYDNNKIEVPDALNSYLEGGDVKKSHKEEFDKMKVKIQENGEYEYNGEKRYVNIR